MLLLFLLYTSTNTLFVKSLEFIPNTKAATVLALDPLFCFIFSFICLAAVCDSKNNIKNGIQFVSAFLSILGVALVCLGASDVIKSDVINDSGDNTTVANQTEVETDYLAEYIGFGYAGMATLGASLYKMFCAKYIDKPCVRQIALILTLIGLIALVTIFPASLFMNKTSGFNNFPWKELSFMACASLVFNFLINYGSVVIFPLFIAVGFTLCLPGNLLIDVIYHGTEFSSIQYFGVLFAFLAIVILVSFSFYESRSKKKVLEEAEDFIEEPSSKLEDETILSYHS